MKESILNIKCNNWTRFSKYERTSDFILFCKFTVNKKTKMIEYNPFDVADKLVVDFLEIGWSKVQSKGIHYELTEKFINNYGTLTTSTEDKNEIIIDGTEIINEAEKLYLHFYEYNRDMRYPEQAGMDVCHPFSLDTVPMTVKLVDNEPKMIYDTPDLLTAIKLAYAFLVTENPARLKYCKHCHTAFFAINPKSEFCSPRCRNQWNVYRSRGKNK